MKLGLPLTALFVSILLPIQLYLFFRLRGRVYNRIKHPLARWTILLGAAAFLGLMLVPLTAQDFLFRSPVRAGLFPPHALLNASYIWTVGSLGCAVILLIYSLIRGANPFPRHDAPARRPDLGRRQFLQKSAGMAAAAPFVLSGYGVAVERRRFDIDHFTVPMDGLSSSLEGLTIVQLTDIHVGPFMTAEELSGFVEATNRLKPDLIALTGDFITGTAAEVDPCVATLAKLTARRGIFACIGNHEIHAGAAGLLTQGLEAKGIQVLRNHGVSVPVGNSRFAILGIDDLRAGRPDLDKALAAIHTECGEAKMLLSHRPEIFPRAAQAGVEIVLSGHYHGGQVKLGRHPESVSVARFLTPYAEGFFQLPRAAARGETEKRRSTLFVGRGVGISGLPVRINCAPQIAHLTLKKA